MGHIEITFRQETIEDNAMTADSLREEFEILEARLLGRADDLSGSFDSAAEEFTDLVGWNIKFRSEEEHQAWVDASANIRFLVGVCKKWSAAIDRFTTEESAIYSDWRDMRREKENALPDKYQYVDESTPDRSFFDWDSKRARDRYDELKVYRDELLERADENMQKHEEEVDEIASMFREGPTEANVNALIEAGHATWGFANIDPSTYLEQDHDLTPENAEQVANELDQYWSGDKPIDDRYHELMLFMGMLGTHAMYAQKGNGSMEKEEMEFLETFYDTLEDENEGGVIGLAETLQGEESELGDDETAEALGIMGDGMLILSDERLGGGYDSLPASVRSVAEGSDLSRVDDYNMSRPQDEWVPRAEALEAMFNNGNKRIEGGAELSTTLMNTVSQEINRTSFMGDFDGDGPLDGLLSTATRNEDANYAILTGDYPDHLVDELGEDNMPDLPWSEHSDEKVQESVRSGIIENIYTYDWSDDGNAARGLTEWIEGDAWSDDEDKREVAAEAMIGLMDTITTKDMHEALSSTGHTVEIPNGEDIENASFGAVNPEIADGFAHLFELYIESFASTDGIDNGQVDFEWDEESSWNDEDRVFNSAPADRLIFLEYVMGDEDSAVRAHTAASAYSATQLEIHVEEGPLDGGATRGAIAQFMVDSALNNELTNREISAEEHQAAQKNIAEKVAGVGSNALGLVPGVGFPLSQASNIVSSEVINSAFSDQQALSPHVSSHTPETLIEYQTSLRVLDKVLENNDGQLPELSSGENPQEVLEDAGILQGDEESGFSISDTPSTSDDAPDSSKVLAAMNYYLDAESGDKYPSEAGTASGFSEHFYDPWNTTYRDLNDSLRYDKNDIHRLYERIEAS